MSEITTTIGLDLPRTSTSRPPRRLTIPESFLLRADAVIE